MKWVVVVIVVILVAPTIARRLEALDPDKADNAAEPGTDTTRRRGIVYRAVRRFGPRRVLAASAVILLILVVVAYVLIRRG